MDTTAASQGETTRERRLFVVGGRVAGVAGDRLQSDCVLETWGQAEQRLCVYLCDC